MRSLKRSVWKVLLLGLVVLLNACGNDKGGNDIAIWNQAKWNQAIWQ